MTPERVDTGSVRAQHPLAEIVAAAGIELHRRGHGWMGCCPFHADATASLSVDGIPDRFHCFGCGASGDVIDFVQRLHGLTFSAAVDYLRTGVPTHHSPPQVTHPPRHPSTSTAAPSTSRAYQVNALAWQHYTRSVGHAYAVSHLRRRRGIDVTALEDQLASPVVGHTGSGWTTLTDQLRDRGVTDDELIALDLAQVTRRDTLIDTLRDRIVVPVTGPDGQVAGLIGRDTSGDPRASKYRNPTRTVSYDKAVTYYQPAPTRNPRAAVVIVEGPFDALAVAATAATAGRLDEFIPLAAGGVATSPNLARYAAHLTDGHIVLAMDGDSAGLDATTRWVERLNGDTGTPVVVADFPAGLDPADWLALHGPHGLQLLDPAHTGLPGGPRHPGPDPALARASALTPSLR